MPSLARHDPWELDLASVRGKESMITAAAAAADAVALSLGEKPVLINSTAATTEAVIKVV